MCSEYSDISGLRSENPRPENVNKAAYILLPYWIVLSPYYTLYRWCYIVMRRGALRWMRLAGIGARAGGWTAADCRLYAAFGCGCGGA